MVFITGVRVLGLLFKDWWDGGGVIFVFGWYEAYHSLSTIGTIELFDVLYLFISFFYSCRRLTLI